MKKVMLSENIKLCMKKTSGAIGLGKMREVKKERMAEADKNEEER